MPTSASSRKCLLAAGGLIIITSQHESCGQLSMCTIMKPAAGGCSYEQLSSTRVGQTFWVEEAQPGCRSTTFIWKCRMCFAYALHRLICVITHCQTKHLTRDLLPLSSVTSLFHSNMTGSMLRDTDAQVKIHDARLLWTGYVPMCLAIGPSHMFTSSNCSSACSSAYKAWAP